MTPPAKLGEKERAERERIQRTLVKTVIALPLLDKLNSADDTKPADGYEVIVDAHLDFPTGRSVARDWILEALAVLLQCEKDDPRLKPGKNKHQNQYVFARLPGQTIRELVAADASIASVAPDKAPPPDAPFLPIKPLPQAWDTEKLGIPRAIYQIWEDFEVQPLISSTISTVKADAARAAFRATGTGIVWAIVDSGIQADHLHFQKHGNLRDSVQAWHRDFTGDAVSSDAAPALQDPYGHGTHVAGIVAGEVPTIQGDGDASDNPQIIAYQRVLSSEAQPGQREIVPQRLTLPGISGMAPRTKLVSLRVLNEKGQGHVSNIIAALNWVQEINAYGRRIRIHGVNLSVGYPFDPEWFACGRSQLCVEVDRLVRSGVMVVVAAGNTGYGTVATDALGARKGGLALSINDPGNAELALTVGSTHREMPHVYGVSYFSGKGPTGDGRQKPDLLAPGEKVLSCAAGQLLTEIKDKLPPGSPTPNYMEYTGTSMAAPHVSGCIASFLSVKQEFIGQPERVKEIFQKTATSLGRDRTFQGHGLVDVMRAIQYV